MCSVAWDTPDLAQEAHTAWRIWCVGFSMQTLDVLLHHYRQMHAFPIQCIEEANLSLCLQAIGAIEGGIAENIGCLHYIGSSGLTLKSRW